MSRGGSVGRGGRRRGGGGVGGTVRVRPAGRRIART